MMIVSHEIASRVHYSHFIWYFQYSYIVFYVIYLCICVVVYVLLYQTNFPLGMNKVDVTLPFV